MPARRPSWVSFAALVVGATLLIVGLIFAIALGPSGRVEASHRVPSPGVVVIGKDALRASSTPVRVRVVPASAGSVTMVRMLDEDAHAVLETTRHTTIEGVGFLPRTLHVAETGDGSLPRAFNADTFLADPTTGDRVEVDVLPSRLPQALLVYPGSSAQPRDDAADVTMTWTNPAWFAQAVVLAGAGAALVLAGLLMRSRRGTTQPGGQTEGAQAGAPTVPGAIGAAKPQDDGGDR